MRAATKVFKHAFPVQGDILISRDAFDNLGFVMFAEALEICNSFIARQNTTRYGLVFSCQSRHLLLNQHQIIRRERALVGKVIKETMLDHWTYRDLRIGKQFLDGICKQVGCGVANNFQTIGVFGRHDGQGTAALNGVTGVDYLAINLTRQSRFGQTRANGRRDFRHGHRACVFAYRAVRKRNLNHVLQNQNKKTRTSRALEREAGTSGFYAVPTFQSDQWNCSSSVEPVKAVTLDLPP
jgi:hypothetical protein